MLVFVLGTGRCGSTLMQEVLARHPDVGFVSNIEDRLGGKGLAGLSARVNGPAWRRLPPSFAEKGRLRFAPSEAYRVLDRRVSPVLSTPDRDLLASDVTPWLAKRLTAFFEEQAEAQARPVFLHKFTGWPRARFLAEVFPEARFIHVVRDGRAVANSWLQMDWWPGYRGPEGWSFGRLRPEDAEEYEASGRSYVTLAALGWKLLLDAFDDARAELPADRWLEVRYEDVLTDPRARVGEMLDFCGLPWTPGFEAGFERYTFSSGRSAAYLRDLTPEQVAAMEATIGGHLRRNGYPVPAA